MQPKKNSAGWIILLITVLLFAAQFVGTYSSYQLAAIPGRVFEAFHLDDMQFSSLVTAALLPSIFLSIVIGLLADRFGISKVVGVCFAFAALGLILRCFAGTYPLLLIAMALSGFGCLVVNANLSKIASALYPMDKVSRVVGIIMGATNAAMALSFATTALIGSLKTVFLIPAVASAAVVILWLCFAKEKHFAAVRTEKEDKAGILDSLRLCITSRSLWLAGLTLFLLLGASMITTNFHVAALTTYKGYTEAAAGSFNSVAMIGAILGSMLLPIYVTKNPKRAVVLIPVILVITAVCHYGMISLPAWGIYVCSLLNAALRSGVIASMMTIPVLMKEIGPRNAGTAGGFIITLQQVGSVVLPTYVIVPLGRGSYQNYYLIAMVMLLLSAAVAFIFMKTCSAFKDES